MDLQELENYM